MSESVNATPTHILGAGWAGMIAAAFWPDAEIYERDADEAALSGTTGAFIRCRHTHTPTTLQAPLRRVTVHRAIATPTWDTHPAASPSAAALYARKVSPGGQLSVRSIHACAPCSQNGHGGAAERYLLLPSDLIAARRRAAPRVRYGAQPEAVQRVLRAAAPAAPVVSTLPLEEVLRHLGTDFGAPRRPQHKTERNGFVLETELEGCDLDFCWTVYVPSPDTEISRITITGSRAIVEVVPCDFGSEHSQSEIEAFATHALFRLFAVLPHDIVQWRWHAIIKLAATPEYVAWTHDVVYRLSAERGIYSLGRAATGRRGVLLDDLPQDCRVINKLLQARSARNYVAARDVAREG